MNDWFEPGHAAIVTGGSRGLGKALARELLQHRLRVVIDGREAQALAQAERELSPLGTLVAVCGDVDDDEHVHALLAAARAFGRLDLLVNNASTLGMTPLPRVESLDRAVFERLFRTNVFAPIHLMQHALPAMRRTGGTIVNVSSDAALEAYPGWGGYGASKAALEHVSRVLAEEVAGGEPIRILVADPGDMNTQMHRDAIPDADPSTLRDPAESARALLEAIAAMRMPFERVRLSEFARA